MITETTTEKTMPARRGRRGVVGLLGHVRRRVIAGQRVLRVQQPDEHHVERDPEEQRARPRRVRAALPVPFTNVVKTVPMSVRRVLVEDDA